MEKREYCMKETKDYPQSEADQDFAKLLKNIRTEEKVSLDQLAMGLMSASQLVKIENGERPINKNIRDRLLERLGIAKELYENLLDLCDFEEWDYKKKILSAIQNKKIEDAYRLLKEYKAHLRENDRINHQFILAMWGEVLKQEGASKEKIAEMLSESRNTYNTGCRKSMVGEKTIIGIGDESAIGNTD